MISTEVLTHQNRRQSSELPAFELRRLMIAYTSRCNAACDHCAADSGPLRREQLPKTRALRCIDRAAGVGISSIGLTGGEVFLYFDDLVEILGHANELGMSGLVDTNGFWATSLPEALARLSELAGHGLRYLRLSTDRYHQEFVPLPRVVNALQAARELGIRASVTVCYLRDDPTTLATVAAVSGLASNITFQPISACGRASDMPPESMVLRPFAEVGKPCDALTAPAISPAGRVSLCCAPPLYLDDELARRSPLVLGWLDEEPLDAILCRAREDPFLRLLAAHGAGYIVSRLNALESGFYSVRDEGYASTCDLCVELLGSSHYVDRANELIPEILRVAGCPSRSS